MRVRTDLQSMGLYIVNEWLLRAMPQIEQDAKFEFASFGEEFVPFIAKNQFKSQICKHAPRPKANSIGEKIAHIMDPSLYTIRKDFVKVHLHVLPKTPSTWFYFPKIVSLPFYQFISQEALRMLKQTYTKEQEMSPFLRYLKSCNCTEITETRRCVSNFMPAVDRVKIVEALHVPELKAEVPTIYIDLTSN